MRKLKFRVRPRFLILAALLLLSFVNTAVGKYITTVSRQGNVTFTANLATSVVLQESTVEREGEGTYTLTETKTTEGQEYTLIPGLDIPKDPHIVIEGKTEIPAYLFIEVVDKKGSALSYKLTEQWIETDLMTSNENDSTFYVYSTDGIKPAPITEDCEKISILKDDKVYVSQNLLSSGTPGSLTFYAYLVEAASFSTAS